MALRDGLERSLERLWYGPRGLGFALAAPFLSPGVLGTLLASRRRRTSKPGAPALPTLAIGNLAVGGTGKTQVVLHLAAAMAAQQPQRKLAIVTRGYGGRLATSNAPTLVTTLLDAAACGDEPLLLTRRLPDALVIVSRDRARGIAFAKDLGAAMVLLDDGLQQTSILPTQRIAVFGAESPLGNGALLPLGPLRDPLGALRPDDLVWLHGDGDGTGLPRVDVRSRTRALGLSPVADPEAPLTPLAGRRLFAFAGIARPERFFETLRQAGAEIAGTARFGDHRRFADPELRALAARAKASGADSLVCTEKDGARIGAGLGDFPLATLRTDLEILTGAAAMARTLG